MKIEITKNVQVQFVKNSNIVTLHQGNVWEVELVDNSRASTEFKMFGDEICYIPNSCFKVVKYNDKGSSMDSFD